MDCGTLDDIENGGVVMSTSTFGSTVTYTCEEGYDLSDDVERTCQADGSWDEDEPDCISKYMRGSSQLHKFIIYCEGSGCMCPPIKRSVGAQGGMSQKPYIYRNNISPT